MDGSISFGQYDVIERLRVGGSTETLRARDNRTDSLVALTRLLPQTAGDPARRRALEDEARVAGSLDHPHIARLLDSGEIDGQWFVAYEHVEGRDLRRLVEHASSQLEPVPLPIVLHVARRVAEAIAHAHEAAPPLLHGCLTPHNISVSFAGDVKVVGFGADKASLGYRSPEQARGEPLDPRTDLFSLGICLWEALTARRLFPERDEALAVDVLARWSPEPPSKRRRDLPLELDRIVMKLLAKDATERYGSARRFSADLSKFVAQSGASASRDDVARYMRETFDDEATRSTGRTMELQETRRMSDDKNGGGSDLDIFEGLGKKSSAATPAAVPPPPPGSGAHLAGAVAPKPTELKKTLLGIAQPAQPPNTQNLPPVQPSSQTNMPAVRPSAPPASGSMRAAAPVSQPPPVPTASKPPPPPGRGSLPNLAAQPASQPPMAAAPSAAKSAPPPIPAAPSTRPTAVAQPAAASSQPNGKQLDMDWDDDDEATHVFDKESRDNQKAAEPVGEPDRADMDAILSSPPRTSAVPMPAAGTPPPPPPATLSGAFASLGQSNGAPSASFKSGPPASQSIRSAPPPPPVSARAPSQSPISAVPPPPPPGSPTTQPMHMPPRPPSAPPPSGAHPAHAQQVPGGGGMHQPMSNFPSAPPASSMAPVPAVPQMPPVSRMMEPTAIVPRPQPSRAGLWVGLLVAVMAIVGIAVFLLMPRTGTLVVNVADTKGASVPNLQVLVDGTKKCDSAPCILKDVPAGVHEVKVIAPGFDSLAPRAITVEARRDASTDFTLAGGKSVGGTGFKVAGNQPGVKVSVDGKDLGTLPAEARDLEPGDHKLHFAGSDRYAPLDKSITIGKDEIVDVGNIQLKVLKGKAMITLGTPGAKVFLVSGTTRKEVPQFPIAIDFDPNEHWQLEAKKDGFDDFVKPISFDDGIAEKTIDVTLSPKGSHTAQPQSQLAAPPVAQAPAARPQPVAKADPPAPKDTSADPAPAAKPPAPAGTGAGGGDSFLNINSLPASTVVLDGKPLGPTPRVHVQVSPGSHTIMFVNAEQSLKKSISVTVGAGETKAAFAKLRD